ncbi:MAG: oxidoreductase [Lentisphaerae bacterium GWF2_44_16]|nr:MAG: oxidoreductase [Lentisphaerae bacterium GWF2_44_16]
MRRTKIGIIGCGKISQAYFNGAKIFRILETAACADINMDAAKAKAEENGVKALSVDELLADPEIKIVVNLTIPQVHTEINMKALKAGKHVYCEKPLALDRKEARKVLDLAEKKKLLVGCAPDTFLGGGLQTCRKLIDDGWIGKPVAGTAFMMCRGHERWHPSPGFYYLKGGGPLFDMGPYYLTALVNLLGPVKRVCASTAMTFKERTATADGIFGKKFPVEVPTHYSGTLDFHSGCLVSMIMSFDVWAHGHHPIEIYGTEGSMKVPDPNSFKGPVFLKNPAGEEWKETALSHSYAEPLRSIGTADMAYAVTYGRKHRCNGELAYHVLDVMQSFEESSVSGKHIEISSTCERTDPFPIGLANGLLDK